MKIFILLLFSSFLTTVRGVVVDPSGLPLAGAAVRIKGTSMITITDDSGSFVLAEAPEKSILTIAMPGFELREVTGGANLRVQLELKHVSEEVSVQTPRPLQTEPGSYAISPLDIVRTPGSQADMFRALQVLPGVARVDDGAGLFVRGGDTSEVLVLLDGATMAHPYRYETPTGGFRGAIDPFMTDGLAFSAGGFSARYGNALSAVLDLRGLARTEITQTSLTAGLAQVSGTFAAPIGNHAGFRVNAQRALPSLLFKLNPPPREFDRYPGGRDIGGSLNFESGRTGALKLFALDQQDHVGVRLEKDAFAGFLHSGTRHRLVSASGRRTLTDRWEISGAFGRDVYSQSLDVGVQKIDKADRHHSSRIDLEGGHGLWTIRTGFDMDFVRTSIAGVIPQRGGDFGGVGGQTRFLVDRDNWRAGAYVEASRTVGRFTPVLGVRADRFGSEQATASDPRASLVIDAGHKQHVRFAWGVFHQAPSAQYFDQVRGASRMEPMAATHYVAGYEIGSAEAAGFLRVEGYHKSYRRLPLERAAGSGFGSDGYGSAAGVDLFVRRAWTRLEIRGSASWLDAKRRWTPAEQRERYALPAGAWAPDFSIPWSGQVVANLAITGPLSLGATWRSASGRPDTPVAGARSTENGFEPIYGPLNSDRLPRYEKLDLSCSLLTPVGGGGIAVFFASLDNVLGHRNFFEYAYSTDYSVRHPVITTSPRTFYFGVSVTK